jgi:RNA polymerase sigma factor (sigma-70 family)
VKTPFPETRYSLILRLPDGGDVDAWQQFVSIYGPLVYRLARSKGFQDADAREIVQEVLVAVSKAVERWDPDPRLGRFRAWLFRIARNLMIKFLTRRRFRPIGSGDSGIAELLEQQVEPSPDDAALFDLEYRREMFRWAAEQVQEQVKERTWRAFWMTSIERWSAEDVARELAMTVGAVHIACSRVRGRIRDLVAELEQGSDCDET